MNTQQNQPDSNSEQPKAALLTNDQPRSAADAELMYLQDTVASMRRTMASLAKTLRHYAAERFPDVIDCKKDFGRVVMEGTADALDQALHDPENQPSQFDTVPAGQLVGVRAIICMVPLQGRSIILPDTPEIRRVLDNQGVTFA